MSARGGEAAIVQRIVAAIGTTNRYAVEVGARDGMGQSTTYRLRVDHGWTCLLLDARPKAPIVHRVFLTAENIGPTFVRHGVPAAFDLLSIDVDGNDFHLWRALSAYRPRVVVVEYNSSFGPDESVVMPYDPAHVWDKTEYYGASAAALVKLGRTRGYTLVDVTPRVNLFFMVDEALPDSGLVPCPLPPRAAYGYPATTRRWEGY